MSSSTKGKVSEALLLSSVPRKETLSELFGFPGNEEICEEIRDIVHPRNAFGKDGAFSIHVLVENHIIEFLVKSLSFSKKARFDAVEALRYLCLVDEDVSDEIVENGAFSTILSYFSDCSYVELHNFLLFSSEIILNSPRHFRGKASRFFSNVLEGILRLLNDSAKTENQSQNILIETSAKETAMKVLVEIWSVSGAHPGDVDFLVNQNSALLMDILAKITNIAVDQIENPRRIPQPSGDFRVYFPPISHSILFPVSQVFSLLCHIPMHFVPIASENTANNVFVTAIGEKLVPIVDHVRRLIMVYMAREIDWDMIASIRDNGVNVFDVRFNRKVNEYKKAGADKKTINQVELAVIDAMLHLIDALCNLSSVAATSERIYNDTFLMNVIIHNITHNRFLFQHDPRGQQPAKSNENNSSNADKDGNGSSNNSNSNSNAITDPAEKLEQYNAHYKTFGFYTRERGVYVPYYEVLRRNLPELASANDHEQQQQQHGKPDFFVTHFVPSVYYSSVVTFSNMEEYITTGDIAFRPSSGATDRDLMDMRVFQLGIFTRPNAPHRAGAGSAPTIFELYSSPIRPPSVFSVHALNQIKLASCTINKECGNELFKLQEYLLAAWRYSLCTRLFPMIYHPQHHMVIDFPAYETQYKTSYATLTIYFSNRCECLLQLNMFQMALVDADKALEIDPSHEKSIARRKRAIDGIEVIRQFSR